MSARYLRYLDEGAARFGRLEDDGRVTALTAAPWLGGEADGRPQAVAASAWLAPVTPTKVVCVGRNYGAHARELGNEVPTEPLIFLKPPSGVVGPGAAIEIPDGVGEVHHEAELGVVVGRRLRGAVSEAEALAAVFGLTCVDDVTARTLQRAEKHFTRAKGFDTFCPVGPVVVEGADPAADRAVRCTVDGAVRQDGRTGDMIFGVAALLAFIASVMTLEPGDLVSTGTPEGVGPIEVGQTVTVEVEGVGTLVSPVVRRR